jgi:hypothetical protein
VGGRLPERSQEMKRLSKCVGSLFFVPFRYFLYGALSIPKMESKVFSGEKIFYAAIR